MRRLRMTLHEHQEAGRLLKSMRNQLQTLGCEISNRCGTSSRETRLIFQSVDRIDRARVNLEERMFSSLSSETKKGSLSTTRREMNLVNARQESES
jgi:hypothetical protein